MPRRITYLIYHSKSSCLITDQRSVSKFLSLKFIFELIRVCLVYALTWQNFATSSNQSLHISQHKAVFTVCDSLIVWKWLLNSIWCWWWIATLLFEINIHVYIANMYFYQYMI